MRKKTLDDYILNIRYGRKFGFEFEKNRHLKVNVLKAFVRKKRSEYLKKHGLKSMNSDPFDEKEVMMNQ